MGSHEKNEGKIELDRAKLKETIIEGAKKTQSLYSGARIFRVPEDLRKLNKSAYTPQLIAIGPLHHDKERLRKMKEVKILYTYYLLDRLAEGVEDKAQKMREKLEECAEKMEKCVHDARNYYAEDVKVNDHEMAEMMLIDGCFILELLCCYHDITTKGAGKSTIKGGDGGNSKAPSSSAQQPKQRKLDPILDNILVASSIKHDLLLFENQIPFSVLEDLFKVTVDEIPGGKKLSLKEYVVSYFHDIMSPEGENSGNEKKTSCCCSLSDCVLWVCGPAKEKKYYHILHLLHDCYGSGDQWEDKQNSEKISKTFSALEVRASQLDNGGVKFEPIKGNNLFDVKFTEPKGIRWLFHRATFEIPTLIVDNPTDTILRNLIAFEQFYPEVSRYFTAYANLMDVLINSEKDVEVLSKANVIRNFLGTDKDVSDLVNKLCKEVVAEFVFEEAFQKASEYRKHWWPRYMAHWRHTYVASPWAFRVVFLALIAFVIQIINFVRNFLK